MSSNQKIVIVVALIVVVGAVLAMKSWQSANEDTGRGGCCPGSATKPAAPPPPLPRLVDVGSTTCGTCKEMKPILDELREQYSETFKVEFIDARRNPDAARGHNVETIPTQVFYDASGKELDRHEGFMSKEDILARWRKLGVATSDAGD